MIESALCIIEQFMNTKTDTHMLLLVQGLIFPICECLILILRKNSINFTQFWFFLLSLVNFILSIGSSLFTARLEELFTKENDSISKFLQSFASSTIIGKSSIHFETLHLLHPTQMCLELLLLLNESDTVSIIISSDILSNCPFLWPSVLLWAIITGDNRARRLLTLKPPNVGFINDLFYHASVCVAQCPSPWLMLFDRPDYRLLRRFCPESIDGIHFFLASDIGSLVSLNFPTSSPSTKILLGWRAWVSAFGLKEFVHALLYVLMWHIQVGTDPLSAMASFRSAGCLMVIVCEANGMMLREIMETAVNIVENEDCGIALNGDGVAEFCLIVTVAMGCRGRELVQEVFRELLEHRKRLVDQEPPTGTAKFAFCVGLIKGALYVPILRGLIQPDIFRTAMMRQEWQAAIDYFIACDETER
jgi:hypothetical protein